MFEISIRNIKQMVSMTHGYASVGRATVTENATRVPAITKMMTCHDALYSVGEVYLNEAIFALRRINPSNREATRKGNI